MIFPEEGECEWLLISDVAKRVSSGGTPSARNPDFYDGGTIPWLRTNEVRFQDIHDTAVYITESAVKKFLGKVDTRKLRDCCYLWRIGRQICGECDFSDNKSTLLQY